MIGRESVAVGWFDKGCGTLKGCGECRHKRGSMNRYK